jgi:hypothetical protein
VYSYLEYSLHLWYNLWIVKRGVLASLLIVIIFIVVSLKMPLNVLANDNISTSVNSSLPSGVQKVINSAIDLEYYNDSNTEIEKASGVKISSNMVLSAGHEFLNSGTIMDASNTYCRDLSIFSTGDKSSEDSTDNNIVATYSKTITTIPDISIINTSADSNLKKLPTADLGSQPNVGDRIYFDNFEPTSSLVDRNPNSSQNNSTQSKSYTLPAIYKGIVINNSGAQYTVVTGLASYGEGIPDDMSRPGASGGPVFNSSGQLIGMVVSIVSQQYTTEQIEATYNVSPGLLHESMDLQVEEIQPITPQIISTYENLADTSAPIVDSTYADTSECFHSPILEVTQHKNIFEKAYATVQTKTIDLIAKI